MKTLTNKIAFFICSVIVLCAFAVAGFGVFDASSATNTDFIMLETAEVRIYKTLPIEQSDEAQQILYRVENVGKVVLIVK